MVFADNGLSGLIGRIREGMEWDGVDFGDEKMGEEDGWLE